MGSIFSTVHFVYLMIRDATRTYSALREKIVQSPGIPLPNATSSYWMSPASRIAVHGAEAALPEEADVVIIGSGITGAAVARALLTQGESEGSLKNSEEKPLKIVMLEAREACSGATGRNGGHASPLVYNEYPEMKAHLGSKTALSVIQFRLAHLNVLLDLAKEEDLLADSQARLVDEYDVYLHQGYFERMKGALREYESACRYEGVKGHGFTVLEGQGDLEDLQLTRRTKGCISGHGAALHPYRLVTGILSNLLRRYPNFHLFTRTPCTSIHPTSTSTGYTLTTPRGQITARHVVHATNAWASHLLPGLREKIIPVRGHMSAQRAGRGLVFSSPDSSSSAGAQISTSGTRASTSGTRASNSGTHASTHDNTVGGGPKRHWEVGQRAFVVYSGDSPLKFDYLTQLLPSSSSTSHTTNAFAPNSSSSSNVNSPAPRNPYPTAGEMMFGTAVVSDPSSPSFLEAFATSDDTTTDLELEIHLSGALERTFGRWGKEGGGEESSNRGDESSKRGDESSQRGDESSKRGDESSRRGDPDEQSWAEAPDDHRWAEGRVKALWSGIIGISADTHPWVGRVPASVSGREAPRAGYNAPGAGAELTAPGEWVCAGYSGEGMVHAWLCGKEVAGMILGRDVTPAVDGSGGGDGRDVVLPRPFLISEERVRRANVEDMMG